MAIGTMKLKGEDNLGLQNPLIFQQFYKFKNFYNEKLA